MCLLSRFPTAITEWNVLEINVSSKQANPIQTLWQKCTLRVFHLKIIHIKRHVFNPFQVNKRIIKMRWIIQDRKIKLCKMSFTLVMNAVSAWLTNLMMLSLKKCFYNQNHQILKSNFFLQQRQNVYMRKTFQLILQVHRIDLKIS